MKMRADPNHVLMSDVLKGNVPSLEGEGTPLGLQMPVTVIVEKNVAGASTSLLGILKGVLLGQEPEIEFRCELKEALDILDAPNLLIGRFEMHFDQRIVSVPGPFLVKQARLDEIVPEDQLCTLGLHLTRTRAVG